MLDTNVVSAMMLTVPERTVVRALDRFRRDDLWTTAVTTLEIRIGLLTSPMGRKRNEREQAFARLVSELFRGRVASFDANAAEAAAALEARRRAAGRTAGTYDAQIAGIAISRRASICTRNVRHFEDAGVPILNPWA